MYTLQSLLFLGIKCCQPGAWLITKASKPALVKRQKSSPLDCVMNLGVFMLCHSRIKRAALRQLMTDCLSKVTWQSTTKSLRCSLVATMPAKLEPALVQMTDSSQVPLGYGILECVV
jgi:hypothetical protein